MSITVEIINRCGEGRLFSLPLLIPSVETTDVETKRDIYVSREVDDAVRGPWEETTEGLRLAELRGHLDIFTGGGLISIADNPYDKDKTAFLARLDPARDGAWQIRDCDDPAIRVFGHFAFIDTFIALTWRWRDELDGRDSRSWRDEINRCKTEWRKLFPTYQPLKGGTLDEYVSEKFYAV